MLLIDDKSGAEVSKHTQIHSMQKISKITENDERAANERIRKTHIIQKANQSSRNEMHKLVESQNAHSITKKYWIQSRLFRNFSPSHKRLLNACLAFSPISNDKQTSKMD